MRLPDANPALRPSRRWLHWVRLAACGWLMTSLAAAGWSAPAKPAATSKSGKILRAGAAASNITPELGTLVVGSFTPGPARHIHDELYARCLVLDDGQTRIGFVICDNLGATREVFDQARKFIDAETDMPGTAVAMTGTHTHSAPNAIGEEYLRTDPELTPYQKFMARRIADGVRRALTQLEPAKIAWGKGHLAEPLNNRRWFTKSEETRRNPFGGVDQVRMNPPGTPGELIKPAGPIDPEIVFLAVQATSGRPIALLANYSLHYVGGVRGGDVSADYFGVFAERMREFMGSTGANPPFVAMLSNGTSGDVNNTPFNKPPRPSRASYEQMTIVGNQVAAEVYRAYQSLTWQDWAELEFAYRELELEPRKVSPELKTWAEKVVARPPVKNPVHSRELDYAKRTLLMAKFPERVKVPVQAFRVGDVGVAAIPAETFTEIGLELKERSPFKPSFTLSIANGYFGYLPTPRQHELGGYETWIGTNQLEVHASVKILDALVGMLVEMKAN